MVIDETSVPIQEPVRAACDMLGFDPLTIANEGKLIAVVEAAAADTVLAAMRSHDLGRDAALVGEVTAKSPGLVTLQTEVGGARIVDMPHGEQLPRIC